MGTDSILKYILRIMRDVNNGWLVRYLHSNTASAFFFLVPIGESFCGFYLDIFYAGTPNEINAPSLCAGIENLPMTVISSGINIGLLSKLEYNSKKGKGASSLHTKNPLDSLSEEDFLEWFIGFVDAEGCFHIQSIDNRFKFIFTLGLHKDDLSLLKYIAQRLGIGSLAIKKKYVEYTVIKQGDLLKILYIFDKRPLNTSKNLNYIMFRKAYDLYFNRESIKVPTEIREKVIELKNQMNKNRIDFNQPKGHFINITPYWLLGFVEGDGYFSVNSKNYSLKFGIGQTSQEIEVLEAVQQFLLGLPGKYAIKRNNSNLVKLDVYNPAKGRDHKPMAYITVNQTDFLTNVLIPFFDSLIWLSKKKKDYQDWRLILSIIKQGKHFTGEGKALIFLIAKRMNNNRLSSNLDYGKLPGQTTTLSNKLSQASYDSKEEEWNYEISIQERASKLLESPSNYEVQPDGKILIKSLGTYLKGRGNIGVRVLDENGGLVYEFSSIKECALFFDVHSRTIIRRLDNGGSFIEFKGKKLVFQRVVSLP